MSGQAGRNDLCPCGSGKKMKACHPNGYAGASKNRNLIIIGIGIAVVAIAAVAMLQQDSTQPLQAGSTRPMPAATSTPPAGTAGAPASRGAGSPQPGAAPPGKVWSPEHNHWHDDPAAGAANAGVQQVTPGQTQSIQLPAGQTANQTPRANTPQPPGPAPEGKEWSPEHGHWHDVPKTAPATPPQGSGPK